ncbi:MAG: ArsR family transcriptional regulator [Sulfobacillus acidophilus]|uniref:ArsR family transcriptional regulator n=1 Tax=Sulfobacillus acidophilus TaxID=53633 RepID=A0A2T2WF36_9FIRM|nr:MAG: ArsR family transcriptional regulator [Sulfobacillus acidophilus]
MYESWAEQWRVLGDATRLHILRILSVRDACVCELVELLPVSQSAVSQHLRKLKYAGLVHDYREKSWIFYGLRSDIPRAILDLLEELPVLDDDRDWLLHHRVADHCRTAEKLYSASLRGTSNL